MKPAKGSKEDQLAELEARKQAILGDMGVGESANGIDHALSGYSPESQANVRKAMMMDDLDAAGAEATNYGPRAQYPSTRQLDQANPYRTPDPMRQAAAPGGAYPEQESARPELNDIRKRLAAMGY
jgi:hypothetical protein